MWSTNKQGDPLTHYTHCCLRVLVRAGSSESHSFSSSHFCTLVFELENDIRQGCASWQCETTHCWSFFYLFIFPSPDAFNHFFWIFRRLRSSLTNAIYIPGIVFKKRPWVIGFVLLWRTTVPNVAFQLSKTKQGAKMIPVQRKIFPRGSPRAQYIVGTRYTCHIFSGEQDVQHTQHTEPAKLRHYLYLLDTLQQFVPAGTAVHNQQDRRRVSDGGRAIYVNSKYSSSTCSSGLYRYFSNYMMYINFGTAVCNQHEL